MVAAKSHAAATAWLAECDFGLREFLLIRNGAVGPGRGDTGRLEVVSKSRRQALRSCAVGLFLVSKPHGRRSGKAGTPFLRPLLALSSVGRESSPVLRTGIEPRCGSRPPCVSAIHPSRPFPRIASRRSELRPPQPTGR